MADDTGEGEVVPEATDDDGGRSSAPAGPAKLSIGAGLERKLRPDAELPALAGTWRKEELNRAITHAPLGACTGWQRLAGRGQLGHRRGADDRDDPSRDHREGAEVDRIDRLYLQHRARPAVAGPDMDVVVGHDGGDVRQGILERSRHGRSGVSLAGILSRSDVGDTEKYEQDRDRPGTRPPSVHELHQNNSSTVEDGPARRAGPHYSRPSSVVNGLR